MAAQHHLDIDLQTLSVEVESDAGNYAYLGSPTVLVDGQDIVPSARQAESNALG